VLNFSIFGADENFEDKNITGTWRRRYPCTSSRIGRTHRIFLFFCTDFWINSNMKAIIALIVTISLCTVSHGVYLAYPIGRNLCQPSDYSAGVELAALDCAYTHDSNSNKNYYATGYCDKYMVHTYACNSQTLCQTSDQCKLLSNVSLGCDSEENLYRECIDKVSDVSKLLGTKSYLTIATGAWGSDSGCSHFNDYKVFPIKKCLQTRSRNIWPSVFVTCTGTSAVIQEYWDDSCQELAGTSINELNTCLGIVMYTCQGY
jgi:hypothetical protein